MYLLTGAVLVVAAVVAVTVVGHGGSSPLAAGAGGPGGLPDDGPAPALVAKGWINSAPLTPRDLSGKVVLYDIWTYSCVNCVRTLPYVHSWYDRYRADGLVVIGVHSPEFDFEKVHTNVQAAVNRLQVVWPVALDDDMTIWNAFGNQYWPAKYLADRSGHIRYSHFGEGEYAKTEDAIRTLLGVAPSSPRAAAPGVNPDVRTQSAASGVTAETYLATGRGLAGAKDGAHTYPEPGPLTNGDVRLVGGWTAGTEKVQAEGQGSAIVLAYQAREVNLVMTPATGPVDVLVELDGKPLAPAYRTAQTIVDDRGRTLVHVAAADMYRLVFGPGVEDHTLRLTAQAAGVQAFAFTFGA